MRKIILIFFICLTACQDDIENFTIKGIVLSKETNEPLSNIELSIICWYYGESPDESYSGSYEKTVLTNDKGEFNTSFDRGAYVEVKIDKAGFANFHETLYIKNKTNKMKISLKQQ